MARLNVANRSTLLTHEGAPAKHINFTQQLRRSVMACLLWEDTFYESGVQIADRIKELVGKVPGKNVSKIATEARTKMKLRHVPLLLAREMARNEAQRPFVAETLESIIQRPDELSEFVSIYWKDGRQPLSAQVKKGLARAFPKFNAYSLAKYNQDNAVKLRDVLFLSHAKPKDEEQAAVWKQLVDGTLASPDTWEVQLSAGKDKAETFTRLIEEGKLGSLALLRNLRNMIQAGVEDKLIRTAIKGMKTERVLPFRFITAAKYAPKFEAELEEAMFKSLAAHEKLPGHTLLLIDVSGSMNWAISGKSEINRIDAANGLAMLLREICDTVSVFTFSNHTVEVKPRRGFALAEQIKNSQISSGTNLGQAVKFTENVPYDRIIVITDEQSHDRVPDPKVEKAYVINVAAYQNGVGYGKWNHIDGWSEAIVDYIQALEKDTNQ